jgi:hypothetical protein
MIMVHQRWAVLLHRQLQSVNKAQKFLQVPSQTILKLHSRTIWKTKSYHGGWDGGVLFWDRQVSKQEWERWRKTEGSYLVGTRCWKTNTGFLSERRKKINNKLARTTKTPTSNAFMTYWRITAFSKHRQALSDFSNWKSQKKRLWAI